MKVRSPNEHNRVVPRVTNAGFTVSWTTLYPSLLAADDGSGRLTTRRDYANTFANESGVHLPWGVGDGKRSWSRFWSSYLDSPERLRHLRADEAWDFLIPFSLVQTGKLLHNDPVIAAATAANAEVLVYPAVIAVIIRVDAEGSWTLGRLSTALSKLRESPEWTLELSSESIESVNLDRIARVLRDRAADLLVGAGSGQPSSATIHTVAAPLGAAPREARKSLELETRNGRARVWLAGLAQLDSHGLFDEKLLLEPNTTPKRSARVYVLRRGHALWDARYILQQPHGPRVRCLLQNHTHLVTHIAALTAITSWASRRIDNKQPIPVAVQPVIKRAALRLKQLHDGKSTYKSEVAMRRIEPLKEELEKIEFELS